MQPTGAEPLRPDDPAVIGPYRLLGRLGEGGMGTVYLAVAPTGRLVAVKVVKAEFTIDRDFSGRFHAEVENARKVASFCTAEVLDNGNSADGAPYMVTEYIAGTPLSRQISQYGALEPGPLHGVAIGVAAALAAIHVAGLVHRDLKPANVILSMSGPRVIDFGIARALDATHGFTQAGELLGSPGWWAPEQVRGEEVTPATDIFAWGCLVSYAGTGRHPYGRGDAIMLAARVLNRGPDLGDLPAPLDQLARRATNADPAQRPTAQDLLIALVGGAIPAPQEVPQAPTLIATEMLNESWEPPANVAEEAGPPQTLAHTVVEPPEPAVVMPEDSAAAQALARTTIEPAEPVIVMAEEPAPAQTFAHTVVELPEPVVEEPVVVVTPTLVAPLATPTIVAPSDTAPSVVTPEESLTNPARTEDTDPRALIMPSERGAEPAKRRSSRTRLLLAAGAVVAALSVTSGILLTANFGDNSRATEGPAPKVPEVVIGLDVGRRIPLPTSDAQVLVPQQPRCELASYQDATAKLGQFCLVRWTMLNAGGELAAIGTTTPRLVDAQGTAHEPDDKSTALPSELVPGGKVDGVLVFDLPAGRKPAKLLLTDAVEVRL